MTDDDDYTSQQIEDEKFMNDWEIERSYAGSQAPLVEHHKMTTQEKLEAIQDRQWWREADRDVLIDMERE